MGFLVGTFWFVIIRFGLFQAYRGQVNHGHGKELPWAIERL